MSKTHEAYLELRSIASQIDARTGLGNELYETISQLVPSVSIDLIIRNYQLTDTLVTWREDKFYGPGWHVPGGVLRFKELLDERIQIVLLDELGVESYKCGGRIGVHEMFNEERDIRGHFISLVYEVILTTPPRESLRAGSRPRNGQWAWFKECPSDLIHNQKQLRKYF